MTRYALEPVIRTGRSGAPGCTGSHTWVRHFGAMFTIALLFGAWGCARREAHRAAFDPDSIPEAYARSTAALTWPGASRAFQVTPEGDLVNGEWLVNIAIPANGVQAARPSRIAFEDRWMPVAHWRVHSDVDWDFEAVALPQAAPRDTGLLVSLLVTASNRGDASQPASLALIMTPLDSTVLFRAPDGASADSTTHDWATPADDALARGWCAPPVLNGAIQWNVPAHSSLRARYVLAAYATPGRELAAWAKTPHAKRVEEARQYWTQALARGTTFELHDRDAEAGLNAALVTLLSCRERRGALWVPIGNPLQYRDVWLRDGARAIRALSVAGFTDESRDLARGLEPFEWPSGAYLSQRGQLDGTGQAMWAFEQAHLRPAADTSVARVSELALNGVKWGERQRSLGFYPRSPFDLMLPWADPRDNELIAAQLVGNDAWLIAGYRSAARLLRAAGRAADADSVETALGYYRADFAKALDATGSPDLPPSWQGPGRDWGNISTSVPCGALPLTHPRMASLAERLWRDGGGPGLGFYGHTDSLHSYLFADLATWAMLTGRRDAATRMLDSLLAWRSASGGIAEYFSRSTRDWGRNAPPHATAAATVVSMLRDCVVYDEDDTLRLTLGARERWWHDADVKRAPTRWGVIDLHFERQGDTASWRWSAVDVPTSLTLPPGTVLAAAPPAPLIGAIGGTRVLAPAHTSAATVRVAAVRAGG